MKYILFTFLLLLSFKSYGLQETDVIKLKICLAGIKEKKITDSGITINVLDELTHQEHFNAVAKTRRDIRLIQDAMNVSKRKAWKSTLTGGLLMPAALGSGYISYATTDISTLSFLFGITTLFCAIFANNQIFDAWFLHSDIAEIEKHVQQRKAINLKRGRVR